MSTHLQNAKKLFQEALEFYTSVILKNSKRIPRFIFGFLAIFGAIMIGLFVGFAASEAPAEETAQEELTIMREENTQLRNLVDEYENLSKLYYEQGTNVSVLMDVDTLRYDPLKAQGALKSMEDYRDMIHIQTGRILELRKSSGFSEDPSKY